MESESRVAAAVEKARLEHDQRQDALHVLYEAGRETHRSQPREIGARIPPVHRRVPFTRMAAQKVANLPENRPSPGHLSALYLLPYLVTSVAGVFDAMHNILLGVNKTLWRSCIVQGDYKTDKGPIGPEQEQAGGSASEPDTDADSTEEGPPRPSQGLFGPRPARVSTLRLDTTDRSLGLSAHQLSLIKVAIGTVRDVYLVRLRYV